MVWWEAVLSPTLQVLFESLTTGRVSDFLRGWNIDQSLIQKLRIAYSSSVAAINEAEHQQHQYSAVAEWIEMLQDAVYEAEDVLDMLATEAQSATLQNSGSTSNQVRTWNFVSRFSPFTEGPAEAIRKVIDKMEYIASQRYAISLKGDGGGNLVEYVRVPSTPYVMSSSVHGRVDDSAELITLLFGNEASTPNISVVTLTGMGGIGKTTLAQYVFNTRRVQANFEVKAWACVSEKFDVVNLTRAILESATGELWDTLNLEFLQGKLRSFLKEKKFLIVLDDVWNEDLDTWNELLGPLMVGARGSRILITSRSKLLFPASISLSSYHLEELSDDACWSIFLHFAFGERDSEIHADQSLGASFQELQNSSSSFAELLPSTFISEAVLCVLRHLSKGLCV